MHGTIKALLNGIHTRGTGGVLYVKGQYCAYRFPSEFPDENFRGSLQGIVEGDESNFYIVEEKDGALHLLAVPRANVVDSALGEVEESRIEEA